MTLSSQFGASVLPEQSPITGTTSTLPKLKAPRPAEQFAWFRAQQAVAAWMRGRGIECQLAGYYDPYDILTRSGVRVEVKYSEFSLRITGWSFNVHRHNKLTETDVDVYVFRLNPGEASRILGNYAIHLVIPAPLNRPTIVISVRSLMTKYSRHFNNIALFGGQK